MKKYRIGFIGILALGFITACGGGGGGKKTQEMADSNIQYLKSNHSSYSQTAGGGTPAPTKNSSALSLEWSIAAQTETNAIKLYDHINFMVEKLKNDENPRAWDKLFLLEAFMKTAHRYTTDVNRVNKNVLITKTATDKCAYQVISAHSDAVSGDFFAQGVINVDYSSIAENIINSADCATSKADLESYITSRQKAKGHQK